MAGKSETLVSRLGLYDKLLECLVTGRGLCRLRRGRGPILRDVPGRGRRPSKCEGACLARSRPSVHGDVDVQVPSSCLSRLAKETRWRRAKGLPRAIGRTSGHTATGDGPSRALSITGDRRSVRYTGSHCR